MLPPLDGRHRSGGVPPGQNQPSIVHPYDLPIPHHSEFRKSNDIRNYSATAGTNDLRQNWRKRFLDPPSRSRGLNRPGNCDASCWTTDVRNQKSAGSGWRVGGNFICVRSNSRTSLWRWLRGGAKRGGGCWRCLTLLNLILGNSELSGHWRTQHHTAIVLGLQIPRYPIAILQDQHNWSGHCGTSREYVKSDDNRENPAYKGLPVEKGWPQTPRDCEAEGERSRLVWIALSELRVSGF